MKAKHGNRQRLSSAATYERLHQIIRRSAHFLNIACKKHLNHLQRVLTSLPDVGEENELTRCSVFSAPITYSVYDVHLKKREIPESITDAIRKLQNPTAETAIWLFLGLYSSLRRFVPNCSALAFQRNDKLCEK